MKKSEKVLFFIISVVVAVIMWRLNIEPIDIKNLDNVLLGTITLASIGVGFLIAAVPILSTLKGNKFFDTLVALGTDMKLLKIFIVSIRILLSIAILSLLMLFLQSFETINIILRYIFYIWVGFLTYSLLLINAVVKIFLSVLKTVEANN